MKKIQILSSALNEEDNLEEFYHRLSNVFARESKYLWELLIVDNGSSDNTWKIIEKLSREKNNVVGFRMSRIFSLDSAFTVLLKEFRGDLAVLMASDLQDTPEVIPELLREYENGFLQVLVKVKSRAGVSKIKSFLTQRFYKIANWSTDGLLPENVSDFRLIDKKVCDALNQLEERNRFIRGLAAWTGFPTTSVEVDRPARVKGSSSTNYPYLIRWSIRSIFANSNKPMNLISNSAVLIAILSGIAFVTSSAIWIIYGVPFAGFGTLVSLLLIIFSIFLICFAILAEYIGLIYAEVKQRPNYIVWQTTKK